MLKVENMIELLGIAGFIIVSGIAFALGKKESAPVEKLDIIEDFKAIKNAILRFNKQNINKMENISQLERYLEPGCRINWKRYGISQDEKHLVVNNVEKLDCQTFIDLIGGSSRKEGDKLYLSFIRLKVSEVEPMAVITMTPNHSVTTTTPIEWNSASSQSEGGEIREVEWENKKDLYSQPGNQTVSLRIMDRNENWSEKATVEFEVVEVGGVKEIKAGAEFLLVVYNSGKVSAIGSNKFGQLGNGAQSPLKELTAIASYENVEQISCGETHVLYKDYQGKAGCVGSNDFGQLGVGNRLNVRNPQKLWGLERVKQMEAGKDFSAAVLMTGAVLTWGANDNAQLGEEKPQYQETPRRVKYLSNVKSVSLGHTHMVSVLFDGSVTAWGDNSKGQVGSGFKGKMIEPTTINIKGVKQAAAGKDFTIVLMESGKVMGWGSNLYGQLGIIGSTEVLFPNDIPKLKNVIKVITKGQFVLALTDIGEVYTWGRYDEHEDEYYPVPVVIDGLKYVKDIAASYSRAYVLTDQDEILTWGSQIDMRVPLNEYMGMKPNEDDQEPKQNNGDIT